jgi:hypothetical protein
MEAVPAEAVSSHEQLVDICCSCLSLLSSLSPPLARLLAGDALLGKKNFFLKYIKKLWVNLALCSFFFTFL